jgi:hypothetical protein
MRASDKCLSLPPLAIPPSRRGSTRRLTSRLPAHEGLSPKQLKAKTRDLKKPSPRYGLPSNDVAHSYSSSTRTRSAPKARDLKKLSPRHRLPSNDSAYPYSSSARTRSAPLPPNENAEHVSAESETGRSEKRNVRQITTLELMSNPSGPVLDYSFLDIADITELRTIAPRSGYRERPPDTIEITDKLGKTLVVPNPLSSSWAAPQQQHQGGSKLVTQTLKLSNNQLTSLPGVTHIILQEVFDHSWMLRWIDLSFNDLDCIPEVLASYQRINTLYLHANRIKSAANAKSLSRLPNLHSLTLHGNPCEKSRLYRNVILAHCPFLRKLDFSPVTKRDRDNANVFLGRISSSSSKPTAAAEVAGDKKIPGEKEAGSRSHRDIEGPLPAERSTARPDLKKRSGESLGERCTTDMKPAVVLDCAVAETESGGE